MNTTVSTADINIRRFGVFVGPLLALFLVLAGMLWQNHVTEPWVGFHLPDDVKAGRSLLARKLSGPGYFEPEAETKDRPFPLTAKSDVFRQFYRVVGERKFGPENQQKLKMLIERLVQSPASRVWGEERLNLLQLNMALDEIATLPESNDQNP